MAYTLGDIGNAPGQVYDFLKRKFVSLTTPDEEGDYSSRKGRISRQEKLAEALSQMGAQEQAVSTAGGITAPVSGMGALARGLTSFGGSFMASKAAADAEALDKAARAEAAAAGKELYTMPDTKGLAISNNDPGTTAAPMEMNMPTLPGQEPSGEKVQYTLNMPNIPGREIGTIAGGARPYEDQQRMLNELDLSDNPYMAKMATGARARIEAERDRNKPTWRQPGDQLFTNEGVAVGTGVPVPPKTTRMPDGLGGYYEFTVIDGKTNTTHYAADESSLNVGRKNTKTIDGVTYTQDENGDWETNG